VAIFFPAVKKKIPCRAVDNFLPWKNFFVPWKFFSHGTKWHTLQNEVIQTPVSSLFSFLPKISSVEHSSIILAESEYDLGIHDGMNGHLSANPTGSQDLGVEAGTESQLLV
jgi:hypothetical protein